MCVKPTKTLEWEIVWTKCGEFNPVRLDRLRNCLQPVGRAKGRENASQQGISIEIFDILH